MQDDQRIVAAGLQAEVLDQLRSQLVQVAMQQAQETQAGGERDGTLGGLENRDRAQRAPPRDGV
jgi:hypothetical protein